MFTSSFFFFFLKVNSWNIWTTYHYKVQIVSSDRRVRIQTGVAEEIHISLFCLHLKQFHVSVHVPLTRRCCRITRPSVSAPCERERTWVWRRVQATVCAGKWPDWAEVLPKQHRCSSDEQLSELPEPRPRGPDPLLYFYPKLKAVVRIQETCCINDTGESVGQLLHKAVQ